MTQDNTQQETFNEMCSRRMQEYEEKLRNPEPQKPHTTCKNHACQLHDQCNHQIMRDGLTCAGNDIGFQYKSAQQAIYADYIAKCERTGDEPMNRFHYFEFGI